MADPGAEQDFRTCLNPDSIQVIDQAIAEPSIIDGDVSVYQFERVGYFSRDDESTAQSPVFNRTVSLRDTWSKLASGQR